MRYSILAFRDCVLAISEGCFRAIGACILAISEHGAIKDCILGIKGLKLASSELAMREQIHSP